MISKIPDEVIHIYNECRNQFSDIEFNHIINQAFNIYNDLLKPSEWVQQNIYLSSKLTSTPGIVDLNSTPFLIDILDACIEDNTEEVVIMKSTQVGISLTLILISLYLIANKPNNILFVLPDVNMAKEFSTKRLKPLISTNRKFIQHQLTGYNHDLTNMVYNFKNMFFKYATANSPAQLASSAVKYLFVDEVDKLKNQIGRESDPISLARERLRTYSNSKIFLSSTPTNEESIIKKYFDQSNQQYFYLPCINCKGEFKFEFSKETFKFPSKLDDIELLKNGNIPSDPMYKEIYYQCPFCNHRYFNNDKLQLIKHGEWKPDKPNIKTKKGFHLNAFYSRYLSLTDIAYEFMNSKDDFTKLRNFKNSWCGEIFQDNINETITSITLDSVIKKQDIIYTRGEIPEDVLFMIGGADVQLNKLFYILTAVGLNKQVYLINYGEVVSFEDLNNTFPNTFKKANNEPVNLHKVYIDSRYRTDEVYDLCMKNKIFFPIKGSFKSKNSELTKYNTKNVDKNISYYDINSDYYKDLFSSLLKQNCINLPKDTSEELLTHLKAEHKIYDKKINRSRWVPKYKSAENHYFDCMIYALFGYDLLNYFSSKYTNTKVEKQKENKPKIIKKEIRYNKLIRKTGNKFINR